MSELPEEDNNNLPLPPMTGPRATDAEVERFRDLEAHAEAVLARLDEERAEDDRRDAQKRAQGSEQHEESL